MRGSLINGGGSGGGVAGALEDEVSTVSCCAEMSLFHNVPLAFFGAFWAGHTILNSICIF